MAKRGNSRTRATIPDEVAAIRQAIRDCLNQVDDQGRTVGSAKFGVYCFYDYDDEPIYVGQTKERLGGRVGRHLTNQRTDAVAMNVLDPFEVLTVELYPMWDLADDSYAEADRQRILNSAEYTVYQRALEKSSYHAVLNEAEIPVTDTIDLPQAYRGRIVPDPVYQLRKHPDIRLARCSMTVSNLARVISERDVSIGLRQTLVTQTRRLQHLAQTRLDEYSGETNPTPDSEPDDQDE